MTILWNEVTIWWNEVTKGWNEVVWNEVVMERSDRIPITYMVFALNSQDLCFLLLLLDRLAEPKLKRSCS